MTKVIVKQVKKVALPVSAPNNVLIFVTDTGELYKGTGTGLLPYSAMLVYNSVSDFPPTGLDGKLYRDNTADILYFWNGFIYIPLKFNESNTVIEFTTNYSPTSNDSDKTLAYVGLNDEVVVTLPALDEDIQLHILNESDTYGISVYTEALLSDIQVPGILPVKKIKIKPQGSIHIRGGKIAWSITEGYESVQTLFNDVPKVIVDTSTLVDGKYVFEHGLNFSHIEVKAYSTDGTYIGSVDKVRVLNKLSVEVDLTSLIPLFSEIVLVGILGGTNKLIPINTAIQNLTIEESPTLDQYLLDFNTYGMIKIDLHSNAILNFKKLDSTITKTVFLLITQDSDNKYDIIFGDSAQGTDIADIWVPGYYLFDTPELTKSNLLTFVWDGHKYMLDPDGTNSVKMASQLAPSGYGVFSGGWDGSVLNTTEKLDWELGTVSVISSLGSPIQRYAAAASANNRYGVVSGGYDVSYYDVAEKLDWVTETFITATNFNLATPRYALGAGACSVYGAITGGNQTSGMYFNNTEKMFWVVELISEIPSMNLTKARSYLAACGNRTYCIFIGGYAPETLIPPYQDAVDKLVWAEDTTTAIPGFTLSSPKMAVASAANNTYGICIGGTNGSNIALAEKFDWATQTRSMKPSFDLAEGRAYMAAASNAGYAIFSGGQSALSYIKEAIKADWITETSSVQAEYELGIARTQLCAFSNTTPAIA